MMYSCVVCEDLMTTCLLFTEKLFVFKYCFINIVLGLDISTVVSNAGPQICDRGSTGGRGLTVCRGQSGN